MSGYYESGLTGAASTTTRRRRSLRSARSPLRRSVERLAPGRDDLSLGDAEPPRPRAATARPQLVDGLHHLHERHGHRTGGATTSRRNPGRGRRHINAVATGDRAPAALRRPRAPSATIRRLRDLGILRRPEARQDPRQTASRSAVRSASDTGSAAAGGASSTRSPRPRPAPGWTSTPASTTTSTPRSRSPTPKPSRSTSPATRSAQNGATPSAHHLNNGRSLRRFARRPRRD